MVHLSLYENECFFELYLHRKPDGRDGITRSSMAMMSVASSDLLHSMNRFNVLLLEDDTDPDGPDTFTLDNSYFNELEQTALIADIEQCLVEHEHFEIAATFGTSQMSNTYSLQIDIDDALGDWPGPLSQFNSSNPFALGFIPTNISQPMYPPQMMMMQNSLMNTNLPNGSRPDITMISPTSQTVSKLNLQIPAGRTRTRSKSAGPQSAPPVPSLSKMFTLSDVLTQSRSPEPSIAPLGDYSQINPKAIRWKRSSSRRNKTNAKAPRLSAWREQLSNLRNYKAQSYQNKLAQFNLLNPVTPNHQTLSPSLSPALPHIMLEPISFEIGDCVFVDDEKLGQIKSIGQHPAWGKGTFYGIRLTEKIGNNDGEFKGMYTAQTINIITHSCKKLLKLSLFLFLLLIN